MNAVELATLRLQHHRLVGPRYADLRETVGAMGALQAQEYPEAKWAIALRTHDTSAAAIDDALADGTLIRTHVLRPTWHLVLAEDIRWLLELTAPRIIAGAASRWRQLELDEATFRRSNQLLDMALAGRPLTRSELSAALEAGGVTTTGQRMPHLLIRAELDRVICSGGMRGKEHTFARFDERVPSATPRDRADALADLARRYLSTRGPATAQDFAWWSGLTVTDAKAAFESIQPDLERTILDGKTYWSRSAPATPAPQGPVIHLLPHYDEFLVAYKDHGSTYLPEAWSQRPTSDDHLRKAFLLDGRVAGLWRRTVTAREIVISAEPALPFGTAEREAFEALAVRFGAFWGQPVSVRWSSEGGS